MLSFFTRPFSLAEGWGLGTRLPAGRCTIMEDHQRRRLEPETKARDLGRPRTICAMLGTQSHVIPSIIETRLHIETWWQTPELQQTQTPVCGPTQRFQAKSASLYQFFSAENCSYNIPSFSVITVEMRRIKYQIGHHDGSTKLWMDSFMPSRRVLDIHSLYLQTAG